MNTNLKSIIINQAVQLTIRKLNLAERYLWDSLVQPSAVGCFMQAWSWADYKEMEGYKTFRYSRFQVTRVR